MYYDGLSQTKFARFAKLLQSKYRHENRLFLAEGVKVVRDLLRSNTKAEALLVLPDKDKNWKELMDVAEKNIPIYALTKSQWQKLSQDKEPEGIMAVAEIEPRKPLADALSGASRVLILHEVSNPGNMGALARSALWFGFEGVILSANSVDYTHPKAVRASMGSIFHLTIVDDVDLMETLPEIKKTHYLIGSAVRGGRRPHFMSRNVALILGSESHGLSENLLNMTDENWSIAGADESDSLSLPQAAAIMMYACANNGEE